MTKYLALATGSKTKEGVIGVGYYDNEEKNFDIFSIPLQYLDEKINQYQPNCILYSRLSFLFVGGHIGRIQNTFPNIEFTCVTGVNNLEKQVISESVSIPGLKRMPGGGWGSHSYPTFFFLDKKINKIGKIALFTLYLHKPWREGENISDVEKQTCSQEKKTENIINNMNPELQELVDKMSQVGKLSYLSSLNSEEISSLLTATENFSKILRQIYPLRKQEEKEVQNNDKENDKDH